MMMLQVIAAGVLFLARVCNSACPPNSLISPCRCSGLDQSLFCKSVIVTEMARLLQPLTTWPGSRFKSIDFTGDIDSRGALRELHRNDFISVTFDVITIRLTSLRSIHEDAFANNTMVTWKLSLPYNYLTEQVFHVTSKFEKLQVLRLTYNRIRSIPANAFSADQRQLHRIDLAFNHISAVGNTAFSRLPKLEQVNLNNNRIAVIGSHAFMPHQMPANTNLLLINLEVNDLTSRSFRNDSLKGSRIVHLYLAINKINVLSEAVFRQVFDSRGLIDLKRNPLKCDCSFPAYLLHLSRESCINCQCANSSSIFTLDPLALRCSSNQSLQMISGEK